MMAARIGSITMVLAATVVTPALGSGGPPPRPGYVWADPQDGAEVAALGRGRLGIVKGATTDALLYLDWRLLNGLPVGQAAATALAAPCCGTRESGVSTWLDARRTMPPSGEATYWISTERQGPNYTTIPNCFDDAFVTAAVTLKDRVARFAKTAPAAVAAWLAGQDAVFAACAKPGVTLPALPAAAPAWLRADRAYQEAALALYDGRAEDAAARFGGIARDPASPWRLLGPYLQARAFQRAALTAPSPPRFGAAHAAIDRLAAAPAGTYGQGELTRMRQVLEFNEHPAQLLARLDRELGAPAPIPDIAVAFRDYMTLSDRAAAKPEAADWIRTIQAKNRRAQLAHAEQRWHTTRKPAWLIAALSLAEPADATARELARDAERLPPNHPGWLSAQYHRLRLDMAAAAPATIRQRADAILARGKLTRSDRTIFTAIGAQQATSLADFVRHALREPYCEEGSATCVADDWPVGDGLVGRPGPHGGFVGLGADVRAIIDRLPLAERIALCFERAFPREIRLDIALTSYARAVQLQDDRAIDRLATLLAGLLPQLAADWRRIAVTPSGPDKRFAEFFVMAKIPSIRVDLADYERPVGTVRQFHGYWVD